MTRGSPPGVQHAPGTGLTGNANQVPAPVVQPLAEGLWPHTAEAHPTECHKGQGQMPSPSPQSTCGLVGQTPMNPRAPCWGYRAGPVFHSQDENHTVPPEISIDVNDIYIYIIQFSQTYHVTMRKQLIERLSGLLYLHRHRNSLLLWHRAVIHHYLLDHLHLFLSISALHNSNIPWQYNISNTRQYFVCTVL